MTTKLFTVCPLCQEPLVLYFDMGEPPKDAEPEPEPISWR
jgi:hypothetical protein